MGGVGGNVDQRPLGRDKIMAVDAAMERPLEDKLNYSLGCVCILAPVPLGLWI